MLFLNYTDLSIKLSKMIPLVFTQECHFSEPSVLGSLCLSLVTSWGAGWGWGWQGENSDVVLGQKAGLSCMWCTKGHLPPYPILSAIPARGLDPGALPMYQEATRTQQPGLHSLTTSLPMSFYHSQDATGSDVWAAATVFYASKCLILPS